MTIAKRIAGLTLVGASVALAILDIVHIGATHARVCGGIVRHTVQCYKRACAISKEIPIGTAGTCGGASATHTISHAWGACIVY